jgi:N-acetylglucosaminyldiphosphoundecaprenol N-acetyl-beta-D-mannosaminyltransferase
MTTITGATQIPAVSGASPKPVTQRLFGTAVSTESMAQALQRVDDAIRNRHRLHIGVVNAAKIVNMKADTELRKAVEASDVVYADGISIVWASKLLNAPVPERITGIDLMHRIMEQGSRRNYRVFCLGATQEILDRTCEAFARQYPHAVVAGSHHGYFEESGEESVADLIRASRSDVLFVAITSPKKERFMAKWGDYMNVPVVHGVGGSFDVVAGLVKRAPVIWQRFGLEWLYRVKQEPRRLWKRYLMTNAGFVKLLILEKLKA